MTQPKLKMDLKKFQDICCELNMDSETERTAWSTYNDIWQKHSLDGDQCKWVCCALYTACRETYTPTVGGRNEIVQGNCVSLTKLLRICNVSLYDFFIKIKEWREIANPSKNFADQLVWLERSFGITMNLFDWYEKIFNKIFVVPPNEKKNKKSRPMKCSASKLYSLCWCLFLCAKNEDKKIVDLVSSFHLLLCCVDLIYINALAENRVDLINPAFEGVPKKWRTNEFDSSQIHIHCILEPLCKLTETFYVEARAMKLSSWRNIMNKFITTRTLRANEETFMDIISNNNFEPNLKLLNSAYEQYVLSVGDFDERIMLHKSSLVKSNSNESAAVNQGLIMAVSNSALAPETPLTRKCHLPKKDNVTEPVASATGNVRKLQSVADLTEPTDYIKQTGEAIVEKIASTVESMKAKFKEKFPIKEATEAEKPFALARSLYYYLLDRIVKAEVSMKQNIDVKVLLSTDTLHTTLITCSVEIVLHAYNYNSQLKFPWVLNCFNLNPFNLIKIIEIVVKRQDLLTRDLIKHLNCIEETCLESLAWKCGSPVWASIRQRNTPLPSWADVDVNKMARCNHERNVMQSPMNSAYECFNTTSTTTASESTRRDLFNAGKASECKSTDGSKTAAENRKDFSLCIFLRKFYTLSWIRMKELCLELEMSDELHMTKIWTLFEYSITHRTELMRDRHLDQLLMCAIYIYIKVREIPYKKFSEIMKFYRKQPQATSNIYRQVLFDPTKQDGEKGKYQDIIHFYNNIYVQMMSPYALNFSEKKKSQHDLILLSPHPTDKINPPKRLSNQLYIHPLEKNEVHYSPNHIMYEFHKSPAKELDKINEAVRRKGKQKLTFDDDYERAPKLRKSNLLLHGKILGMTKDRQAERK